MIAVGIGAYHNSFSVPFVFDDHLHITENPRIHHLLSLWEVAVGTPRPIVYLSLAVNYALGGLHPWGYHALNLVIHILAGLVLFGIVRRTLQGVRVRENDRQMATGLALASALIWVVHPLQTESVTYIIQRAESMMGLFYLFTLYSVIRSIHSPRRNQWIFAAILSCALGVGSKPIMVTAPLAVVLYDRIFLSDSWAQVFRQRKDLYLGLASTWGILITLLTTSPTEILHSRAGFSFKDISPMDYCLTQPGVILHYLKLAFWPHPLVLDYRWPVAKTLAEILLPAFPIGALAVVTLWALRRRPTVGFLGGWFFLTLVPTSGLIPISDLAAEHRIYLPLAAVVTGIVMAGHRILWVFFPSKEKFRWYLASGFVILWALTLGVMTARRNWDYRSEEAIWRDTATQRPHNPRAHNNLGLVLTGQGKLDEAINAYRQGLRLNPDYTPMHVHLGEALVATGKIDEAMNHYAQALRFAPNSPEVHNDLGIALGTQGKFEEALAHFSQALKLKPDYPEAYNNLGVTQAKRGKFQEAAVSFSHALRLKPDDAQIRNNLAAALARDQKSR